MHNDRFSSLPVHADVTIAVFVLQLFFVTLLARLAAIEAEGKARA
jgi:hypothetical protein